MDKFWMVLRSMPVAGTTGPRVRHKTWIEAVEEAKRLATKEGVNFTVLEASDEIVIIPQAPILSLTRLEVPALATVGSQDEQAPALAPDGAAVEDVPF